MDRFLVHSLLAASLLILAHARHTLADTVPDSVLACAGETDDAARLACYDREIGRHVAKTSDAAPATDKPPATLSAEERFGMSDALERKVTNQDAAPKLERLTAKVSGISRRIRGERVITLENGQVWVELRPANYFPLQPGDAVTIKAGAFNSFMLVNPTGRTTRVTRVQ